MTQRIPPWYQRDTLLTGSTTIYDTSPQWPWPAPHEAALLERVANLERRVARLESMQRRWPKRQRRGRRI